ncbi:FtsK/SpoIIIE family DNA translocase [Sphingobium lignivorans]|uniref:DNA translocase FtsK n=1 Tax=Sphingobium lignivorans TaxID=2735886 RepID=A0ABR6NCE9_9SPHN|nr:DNA translocase FtsK 4TM domain-containing protein [Sphingobium lignivorans]MBB5984188.1 S-DNA-T family DNA segregation ATPase FtsK/SpoIIIE [Sphingobium lignivorans]
MASRASGPRTPEWQAMLRRSLVRIGTFLGAVGLYALALFLFLALLSYKVGDTALNTAAGPDVRNLMGAAGAWAADFLYTIAGVPALLLLPLILVCARRLWADQDRTGWQGQVAKCAAGLALIGTGLWLLQPEPLVGLPARWGGVIGFLFAQGLTALTAKLGNPADQILQWLLLVLCLAGGLWLWVRSLALEKPLWHLARPALPLLPSMRLPRPGFSGKEKAAADTAESGPAAGATREAEPRRPVEATARQPITIQTPNAHAVTKAFAPVSGQSDLFGNGALPSADLLSPAPETPGSRIDRQGLERNARLLESVLDDFHVKGAITEVRPGPVVTMYELEPAPGIKASRVIQLADDIARNMSALSARVATIPGRTVIGIELPNADRESVVLHQLITSQQFADQKSALPIILGKNIFGEPVIADLAAMPHLLVAGTTGSGKSVGLNCMILSLLYRLTPDELRLIMIDPKMLELSIYDNIPHLLSPVVTEPAKAIRALKWAVEQMEDRYRMMASIGVRNLANYNEKVRSARAKGKTLGRRVQIGFDEQTRQPVYEDEELDYQPLPQIVVVVDELADLMMTAGKEVEFLIQRLAQKARAAGIHLILATQRPSVDVITGVIKANLPTRISFFVTSKIDSRTILGEQGAEQLLGKGDMLYMASGKGLVRVHGPFVSDDEVRLIADHWRSKGQPDYISAVTEEPEDGSFALDGVDLGDDSADAKLFRKACQLVFENQKASTSWLQRQMRIGYNSAARLIERMENEGMVGAPNHVGRREVLRDEMGNPK